VIRAAPEKHLPWLVSRVGVAPQADLRAIESIDARGRILGMVGFCDWKPNSVQLHFSLIAPTCVRELAHASAEYVFAQERRQIALAYVSANNVPSRRLVEWLGFRERFRIPDGWARGVDLLLFEMRREGCRWLNRKAA
jgi:RimJ/RimL family protein N-acetyltransferase